MNSVRILFEEMNIDLKCLLGYDPVGHKTSSLMRDVIDKCHSLQKELIEAQDKALAMAKAWDDFDKVNEEYIKSLIAEIATLKGEVVC